MTRQEGTVKWFSAEKGFGFITRDDGSDVFVHHTAIMGRGFRTLDEGERVEFEIMEEPKGLRACNVVRLNAPVVSEEQLRERTGRPPAAGPVSVNATSTLTAFPPEPAPAVDPRAEWMPSSPGDREGRRARDDRASRRRDFEESDRGRRRNGRDDW
jgi:cold shock protein